MYPLRENTMLSNKGSELCGIKGAPSVRSAAYGAKEESRNEKMRQLSSLSTWEHGGAKLWNGRHTVPDMSEKHKLSDFNF